MYQTKFPFRHSALALITLTLMASNANAFGNACKNVNFSVDNENDYGVVVTKFELWSASEGRWLSDDFRNITVPGDAKDYVVRRGENVEHAENDRITQIRVHYEYTYSTREGSYEIPPKVFTAKLTSTDTTITDPICVAGRWYKATILARTRLGS